MLIALQQGGVGRGGKVLFPDLLVAGFTDVRLGVLARCLARKCGRRLRRCAARLPWLRSPRWRTRDDSQQYHNPEPGPLHKTHVAPRVEVTLRYFAKAQVQKLLVGTPIYEIVHRFT